ncbi:MAG: hypothetical protein Q4G49_08260 [Paracoccus sp. (in: a-proteobacteria)]|nr:hypothetical protein [Paracoccus sp. (in: a-proteobacteria)]
MRLMIAAPSGALFGIGLMVSGMTNPATVRGWLDVFGDWNPMLGFVLGGAMIPMVIAWRIAARRHAALSGGDFSPSPARIDARLIGGAALFGLGWGLSGLCPGPAIASVGIGGTPFLIFFAAMAAGMALFGVWNRRA